MSSIKDPGQFNPNRRQIVHIKKAAIINFFRRDPPKRQPIGLRVEQLIKRVEAARVAWFSVNPGQCLFDCLLHLRRLGAAAFQTSLDDLLLANALRDALWIGFSAFRQIFECG